MNQDVLWALRLTLCCLSATFFLLFWGVVFILFYFFKFDWFGFVGVFLFGWVFVCVIFFILCLLSRKIKTSNLKCVVFHTKFKLLVTSTCISALISSGCLPDYSTRKYFPYITFLDLLKHFCALLLPMFSKWCWQEHSSSVFVNQNWYFIEKTNPGKI